MAGIRILDLDGSLAPQADLFAPVGAAWVPAQEWGGRIRLACAFGSFNRIPAMARRFITRLASPV